MGLLRDSWGSRRALSEASFMNSFSDEFMLLKASMEKKVREGRRILSPLITRTADLSVPYLGLLSAFPQTE